MEDEEVFLRHRVRCGKCCSSNCQT